MAESARACAAVPEGMTAARRALLVLLLLGGFLVLAGLVTGEARAADSPLTVTDRVGAQVEQAAQSGELDLPEPVRQGGEPARPEPVRTAADFAAGVVRDAVPDQAAPQLPAAPEVPVDTAEYVPDAPAAPAEPEEVPADAPELSANPVDTVGDVLELLPVQTELPADTAPLPEGGSGPELLPLPSLPLPGDGGQTPPEGTEPEASGPRECDGSDLNSCAGTGSSAGADSWGGPLVDASDSAPYTVLAVQGEGAVDALGPPAATPRQPLKPGPHGGAGRSGFPFVLGPSCFPNSGESGGSSTQRKSDPSATWAVRHLFPSFFAGPRLSDAAARLSQRPYEVSELPG